MKKYRGKSREEIMRLVTTEIILRAIKIGSRKGRTIFISKTAGGKGVAVETLNPNTIDGRENLQKFLTPTKRHYTIFGLGHAEEKNAISWRVLNLPLGRRVLLAFQLILSLFLKGTPLKNRLYRWMGAQIGQGVVIMQSVWLDHFRPELISIGENTLIGAFSRLTVHAFEGGGKFRYGMIDIGANCTLGAGTGMGPIKIEDEVRVLPDTTLSPYFVKIKAGSVVGWNPPSLSRPD